MKTLLLALLLSSPIMAQTVAAYPPLQVPNTFLVRATEQLKDASHTTDSWYTDENGYSVMRYVEHFAGEPEGVNSIYAQHDGTIRTEGMWTEHDWLTVLVGQKAEEEVVSRKNFQIELKAALDKPPVKLRTVTGIVNVKDVTRWSAYISGDTNCELRRIRTVSTDPEKRVTALHEMMHVASNCNGDEQLHRAIQQIAPRLLRLLRDNPDMVDWLLSRKPKPVPTIASMQIILDPIQAKYPGNELVDPCSADNHDEACYDPLARHITNHLYGSRVACEQGEQVSCTSDAAHWAPIGKPVFEDRTEPK